MAIASRWNKRRRLQKLRTEVGLVLRLRRPSYQRKIEGLMKAIAVILGAVTLVSAILLLGWDIAPQSFPDSAHLVLGAIPLALIAVSYLFYQGHVRPSRAHLIRAIILALAFLCWAENQLLGDGRLSTLFNDLAIALFVFDVFLTMVGWAADTGPAAELL